MNGLVLIVYALSIALACMTLSLAIAFHNFHKTKWSGWYIVFQSCLLGSISLGFFETVSDCFFSPGLSLVFYYIFKIMADVTMGVVVVLLPYFMKWIINKPWGAKQRAVFYTAGITYFAAGLVSVLVRAESVASITQSSIFMLVYIYCLVVLWRNLSKVDSKQGRRVCLTLIIVTLSMIPGLVVSFIFEWVETFSYPVYVLAFSIVMLVYLYIRMSMFGAQLNRSAELDKNILEEHKITEREYSVIELICDGLTNKEIAAKLNISVNTVNNHVANIFEKMGARSRVDLMKMFKVGPWD